MGSYDYWVAELDSNGTIIWQNTIGGISNDTLRSVIRTSDHGFMLAGSAWSGISGDKTETSKGYSDYWLVKLDSTGNIEWDKTLGGTEREQMRDIVQTPDGGYFIGGSSFSNAGEDKSQNSRGNIDYWVVRTDGSGNKIWDKTIGGSAVDKLHGVVALSDGTFVIAGNSDSDISGEKTENHKGGRDYWILKLDASGNIIWQNTIGGTNDDLCRTMKATSDGGFIMSGYTWSGAGGDKSENSKGWEDFWIVKVNSEGELEWENTIGGNNGDLTYDGLVEMYDHGFAIAGYSYSPASFDKSEDNAGECDLWLVRTDSAGEIIWDKTLGCENIETIYSMNMQEDGAILVIGQTNQYFTCDEMEGSGNGDWDVWAIQFVSELCLDTMKLFADADGDGYGNADVYFNWIKCESQPVNYVADSTDCDDSNPAIYPGAMEINGNEIDEDCNTQTDIHNVSFQQIYVFPNPVKDHAFEIISDAAFQIISIHDFTGQSISFSQPDHHKITLGNCASGLLYVELELNGRVEIVKVIVI